MRETLRVLVSTLVPLAGFLFIFLGMKWHVLVAALIAVLLYFALYLFLKPVQRIGRVNVEDLKGGAELHQLMSEAQDDMRAIYTASQTVKDEDIKHKAARLHAFGNSILNYLSQNPDKISGSRRFFSYYLDTGANILTKYMKLAGSNPDSEQVRRLTPQTSQALDHLYQAFMGQFSKLMQNELMDVEADIELLEKTLKMEGMA